MSRRETAYRLGIAGAVVVLLAVIGLWFGNPGLTRSEVIDADGLLVVLAVIFVVAAIVAHLRGGGR